MKQALAILCVACGLATVTAKAAEAQQSLLNDAGQLWGYSGTKAPKYWGDLAAQFHVCRTGKSQSPVNIPANLAALHSAQPILQYKPTTLRMARLPYHLAINLADAGGLSINGKFYQAEIMTFRAASEHRLSGKQYPLEVQIHHRTKDGNRLILAGLVELGKDSDLLNSLLPHIPHAKGVVTSTLDAIINPGDFFAKASTRFIGYQGSETTPPCGEGISWLVSQQPVSASGRQIKLLSRFFSGYSRPTQPLNGRLAGVEEPATTKNGPADRPKTRASQFGANDTEELEG